MASKGVDLRIEELKYQNRQLLEELFSLKKGCENKDEEIDNLKEKVWRVVLDFAVILFFDTVIWLYNNQPAYSLSGERHLRGRILWWTCTAKWNLYFIK